MLSRYKEIIECANKLGIENLTDILPTYRGNRTIEKLSAESAHWNSIAKSLQSPCVTCADVIALFAGMMFENPSVFIRLSSRAEIVHYPDFESG